MYIVCINNNGKRYLQMVEAYSIKKDGHFTSRRRVIKNIGPLDRFDDGRPDYLARLRESFKEGRPLIPELKELAGNISEGKRRVSFEFDKESDEDCFSNPKNIGYFVLGGLFSFLGIGEILTLEKSRSKVEYDVLGLSRLLIFNRFLSPYSKRRAWERRDDYLFPITVSENEIHIYRVLDILDKKAVSIQKKMDKKITEGIGRNKEICFYDVTNYFFEITDNDSDILGEDGKVIKKGVRKKGAAKEKRSNPIVQMGLFTDDNSIPISYKLFSGNETDQTTLRPLLKESIDKMGYDRVLVVADGGCNSGKNIAHVLKEKNGYIFSKSTKKTKEEVKRWIIEERGYSYNKEKTFKVKSKVWERVIEDENGKEHLIEEKIVSYWSKGHYERALKENKKFLEFLESVKANPDKLKDRAPKYKKYLKEIYIDKKTKKQIKPKKQYELDFDKINLDLELMGYYTLLTSETNMPDLEVINKYKGLSKIENAFRTIKSNLSGRPIFVKTKEHINAHFLICFIALTMIRLLQFKILKSKGKKTNKFKDWELGISPEKLTELLREFKADTLPGGYFRLTKIPDELDTLINSLGVNAKLKIPSIEEMRKLKLSLNKINLM